MLESHWVLFLDESKALLSPLPSLSGPKYPYPYSGPLKGSICKRHNMWPSYPWEPEVKGGMTCSESHA